MQTYLGLDLGGTKLLIGEVTRTGAVLRSKRYSTGYTRQRDAVTGMMAALEDYRVTVGFTGDLTAVGSGVVGTVDNPRGEWIALGHEPTGAPVPLAAMLTERLGIPAYIDNDVRSAVTAELVLGCGKYSDNFIYLNVGTGLAAGFVINRQILRGANHNAGEIGHMSVDITNRDACICGRHGCAENAVSGAGFTHMVKKYGRTDLLLPDTGRTDVPRLFTLAAQGDADCTAIADYAADTLACVIMNLVRVSDPDTVVFGGGIMSDAWFQERVRARLEPGTMRGVTHGLVPSSFSPHIAGLLGAASLGMR